MFAEGAVGEPVGGALAADPLVDASPMEPVLAVVDLPQHLTRLELVEADAAWVSGATATVRHRVGNLCRELSYDRIKSCLPQLLLVSVHHFGSHQVLQEGEAPKDHLLPL